MRARLKKRYPRDHRNRKRWVWLVRTRATDGADQGDVIGFWTTASRDTWHPRAYKGRTLPRLSEAQATAKLRRFDDRIEQGKQDKPKATEWDRFVDDFVDRNRGTVRDTTIKNYEISLRKFGKTCEPKSARVVDRRIVKLFVQRCVDAGCTQTTVNKYLDHMRRVWNSEFPNHPNPFRATRSERQGGIRRFKVAAKDWHRTTPDELQALLSVCENRWQAMILLAYTTGLREAEIWNLTWADVDLDAMIVSVNPKPDTKATWQWSPKDHERRTLPLTPEAKMAVLRLERPDEVPYLFVPADRYARIQRDWGRGREGKDVLNNFLRAYRVRCRWAEVPEEEFHALRKTCITNWLEARVPPHEVQKMAGHSSVETTMKYYAKVDRSAIDRARKASVAYTKAAGHAG